MYTQINMTGFRNSDAVPRVTLGPGAPAGMADFIAHAGIELVPFVHRQRAQIYVDFCGARPTAIEIISIELQGEAGASSRPAADLVTNSWPAAACLVISTALGLKPVLLSADDEMLMAIKSAVGVATTHVPVVISGEIGSGKYNIARLIHHASRCGTPLLAVNCAAFDNVDLATVSNGRGQGRPAAGLFLDEIGELGEAAQIKLLNLLQARERVPTPGPPLRLIAATNRPLTEMVERGEFRRELFWRLNVFSVGLPPLRQRRSDVPMLARYFLRRANPRRIFTPAALKLLGEYAFPGNVLELENLVTRLAIAPLVVSSHFVDVADIRRHLVAVNGDQAPVCGWKASREEARREMVLRIIAAAGGDRIEAARRLGITQRALQYHITKAGLSRPRKPRTLPVTANPAAANQSASRVGAR
ncbi:MAG: sigma 54-interacting transcriptional regulator [Deltaproteobacteria bacterium]|nr:sigma 54-interacting transcriptional regulator [Deltaproteobacteria bacterium]